MITEKEIYKLACGTDEKGINRSLVKVETAIISDEFRETEVVENIILDNPSVNMIKTRSFTLIDLTFEKNDDYELMQLRSILKGFLSIENTMDEEKGEIPAVCVSICPRKYNGEYIIVGMHAMWALHESSEGKGLDTIRFIVENGFMHTYQINIDETDPESIETLSEKEMKAGIY